MLWFPGRGRVVSLWYAYLWEARLPRVLNTFPQIGHGTSALGSAPTSQERLGSNFQLNSKRYQNISFNSLTENTNYYLVVHRGTPRH